MKEVLTYFFQLAALFIIYYLSGVVGLTLEPVGGFATYVWLPTGLSLVFLLLYGYRLWPAVFLGALFVNLSQGAFFFIALGIALGNTLEAVIGAYLLNRFSFSRNISTYKDVAKLIFLAAVFSTAISAFIGITSLYLGGVMKSDVVPEALFAWWLGDAVSNLVFAPFLLLWIGYRLSFRAIRNKLELIILLSLALITGLLFFFGIIGFEVRLLVANFVFPFLIWAAVRFNQKISALVVFIFSILAVVGAVFGKGPFGVGSLSQNLYLLQAFMGITSITSLFLAVAFEERREIEKRKNDFLSIVSHELKTPLTTLKAFVQLGLRNIGKSKSKESLYFGKIDQQLNRITALVNDLQDISKIQRQVFSLEKREFSLSRLVKEVIEEAKINNHDYKIELEGEIEGRLWGDRERIRQVVRNLVSNAIKYSPKSKKIEVELISSGKYAIVAVKDHGIGIPNASQKEIFNLFYRAENGQKIQGLGIGLYFSKHIIREHGGEIWFESKKNHGTTFYFSLSAIKS